MPGIVIILQKRRQTTEKKYCAVNGRIFLKSELDSKAF
jgi:hypothetical protein